MVSPTLVLQSAIFLPGVCASFILAFKAGLSYLDMMKNRQPDAPRSVVFCPLRALTESSRYTDAGNLHRVRGNRLFLWSILIMLSTALAVQIIWWLGPLR